MLFTVRCLLCLGGLAAGLVPPPALQVGVAVAGRGRVQVAAQQAGEVGRDPVGGGAAGGSHQSVVTLPLEILRR